MYHLYIIRCADGSLYTGIAVDVARRVKEHNTSPRGAKYTRSRRPVKLVYSTTYRSRPAAAKAEAKVKRLSRSTKLLLVRGYRSKMKEPHKTLWGSN